MAKTGAPQEAGTDLAPASEGPPPAMIEPTDELLTQAWNALFNGTLPPEVGDPSVTARAIQMQIREGKTFDDVFAPAKLPSWQDYTDIPVVVHAFHLNPSTYKDGQAIYAVAEIGIPETGEIKTVQCGGGNVLTQLIKAWEQGWFPFRAVMRSKPTGEGNTVLRLEKA